MPFPRRLRTRAVLLSFALSVTLGLAACGGDNSPAVLRQAQSFAVAKAQCGADDRQETGLQGQVPLSAQVGGFKGFNCNLHATSATPSVRGEGLFGMFALIHDKAGRTCGYTGGAFKDSFGTSVVDLTDPQNGVETAVLKTPGVVNPGEGLRVNAQRGLLIASYYNNAPSTDDVAHGFDVYDVATDCRHPQLLASTTSLSFPMAGLKAGGNFQAIERIYGHEGWFSPDGLTYYVGDLTHGVIHAVDITDPTKPDILDTYQHPSFDPNAALAGTLLRGLVGGVHGGSISTDGSRGYIVSAGYNPTAPGGMVPQSGEWHGGYAVVDTSEIQARKPGGKMKFLKEVVTRDLAAQQHTIPVTIRGNKYVFLVGEAGAGQFNKPGIRAACAAGVIPFATAQLFSLADETNPQLINKTMLEAQDPKNCSQIMPDIDANTDPIGFLYDVHHCSVDNRDDATTLACGNFYGGIRVFDIRDPQRFKEIAYYVPPAKSGAPKWCASVPIVDAKTSSVYSWCADTGVVALKFREGVWPFPDSSTPPGKEL